MALIEVRGVAKRFGPQVVFERIDLEVRRGEIVALLGPSGAGKTVLLKMIVGLLRPDEGEVLFDGIDLARTPERHLAPVRRRIGFVFQGSALFDSLRVAENVGYALRVAGARRGEVAARVEECLRLVGLPGTERMRPAELSGGMRKRIAIARALATAPEALLYDEPTVGLDPANVGLIARLITDLRDRLHNTALFVTHDAALTLAVADRIALLRDGRLAWVGPAAEARAHPPAPLAEFLRGGLS